MKRISAGFLALSVIILSLSASVWEGAASRAAAGELPETGYYIATNSFPRNTVVDVLNLETGKSIRSIVVKGLDTPGLLALLSKEAADFIGMQNSVLGRIRMTMPADPIAFSRFTEGLGSSGDPDFDPKAAVAAATPVAAAASVAAPTAAPAPATSAPVVPAEPVIPLAEVAKEDPYKEDTITDLPEVLPEEVMEETPEEAVIEEEIQEEMLSQEEPEVASSEVLEVSETEAEPPETAQTEEETAEEIVDVPELFVPPLAAAPADESIIMEPEPAPMVEATPIPPIPKSDSVELMLEPAEDRPPPPAPDESLPKEAEIATIIPSSPTVDVAPVPPVSESEDEAPLAEVEAEPTLPIIEERVETVPPVQKQELAALEAMPDAELELHPPEVSPPPPTGGNGTALTSLPPEPVPDLTDTEVTLDTSSPALAAHGLEEEAPILESPPTLLKEEEQEVSMVAEKIEELPSEPLKEATELPQFKVPVSTYLQKGSYYLQLGAYGNNKLVEEELKKIGSTYPLLLQAAGSMDKPIYRILVGPVNLGESGALLQRFKRSGYPDAFIRKEG